MATEDKKATNEPLEQEEVVKETVETTSEVDVLKEELQNEKNRYLRLFAEFENYKKRTAKERLELFETASEGVMTVLLPILDDFDGALQFVEDKENDGLVLISNKLRDSLTSKGLSIVDLKIGDAFNVDSAEAITQIPAGDDMKGKIVDIVEKGYKLGEKIIRFPKVVIGQ